MDPAFRRRASLILENLELPDQPVKILEVGCGRGFYLRATSDSNPHAEVAGIDLGGKYLQRARLFANSPRVTVLQADATSLPFENEEFDRVVCSELLEHVPNHLGVTQEINRVLKPGGIAMFSVPCKTYPFLWDPLNWTLEKLLRRHVPANIWWLAGIWADHVRLYDMDEFVSVIQASGLKVEQNWRATHYCLPASHFLLYGLGKNIVERGLAPGFYRFSENQQTSKIAGAVQGVFNIFDKHNTRYDYATCMNLVAKARKI